ncbi:hypothetical protein [Hanamia caeni]|jgi:hypothetical protein|uniref:hypothetical protein n=1 Tax=Hanamia caeni TaxID=2294116 RepID=UPI0011CD7ED3|nr:hypothetical protein [Hanamia caeni]
MNNIIKQPTVQLDNYEQQERLVREVNVNENSQKRNFTTIDMWNRNRKVRSATAMLRRWHLN